MTGSASWSTQSCARNSNLTILTNSISTNRNLSWRMTHRLLWDFEIQTDHLISAKKPDLIIINKNERTCIIVDFTVQADHGEKLKECEKRDKYLDFARKLKKLRNMKVMIILIVICTLRTVTKGLVQGLEDLEVTRRVETLQNTALLRSARILRRILETWEDLLSLKPRCKSFS